MTVKELREALANLPDDALVILQKDVEGNGCSPCDGVDAENVAYRAENTWSGEIGPIKLTPDLQKQGYGSEDLVEGVPCVVLIPIN